MKKYLLLLLLTIFSLSSFSQEYIFKFKVDTKDEFKKMNRLVSIDHGYGVGEVVAYANAKQFEYFKTLGYKYEMMPHPGKGKSLTMATTVAEMVNWDRYPTHDVYIQMMDQFATDYPSICRIETIGTSEDGRLVKVAKITDNPDVDEEEPEFFYTGQMHGDEIVDYIMFLRLIDYMLSNYGTDSRITNLINNVEIWINPLANPDGTYASGNHTVSGATRSNANYFDLNRNFPTPTKPNPSGMNEAEVQMMINFAEAHHFVFSSNSHSGAECVNYPWDSWVSSVKTHADHNWLEHISHNYADSVHAYSSGYMTGFDNGVTHGGDWYVIEGGRQDHMTYYQHCREITLELSNVKMLDCEDLPDHWNYNRSAFFGFIEECFFGFNGTVKNTIGDPLDAKIEITSHDLDNSEVYTDPAKGDYYRPIEPGTYSVIYSSEGYISQTINVTVSDWETTTIQNVVLEQATQVTVTGTVTEDGTGNPLESVKIEFTGTSVPTVYTIANGTYSVPDVYENTYQIKASKSGYTSVTQTVDISTSNNVVDFVLTISNAISFESEVPSIFTFSGDADWFRSNNQAYDGDYSMESGDITHNGTSVMETELNILSAGNITFYKKVSSESGYDFLRFYIDGGSEQGEWSGEVDWSQESYPVTTGTHIFKWEYSKDVSDNSGSDCAWVDYIEFPDYSVPGTYIVTFNVTDGTDAIQNANVYFNSQNINTNASGQAVFTDIEPGTDLPWEVTKDGYDPESGNLTITNDNVTKNVILTEILTYTVTFNVIDGINPIENANVNFNSEDILTNSSGTAVFEDIIPATGIPYTVTKSGFITSDGALSVVDQDVVKNITLLEDVSVDVILSLSNIKITPNPFANNTVIEFSIDNKSNVFAAVYSYKGELVNVLLNNELDKGNHKLIWDGTNNSGGRIANGLYFCKIISNNNTQSDKIILLK